MAAGRDAGSSIRATTLALIPGLLAAAAVLAVSCSTLRLEPGTAAWSRLVGGVGADGLLRQRTLVLLPGLPPGSWLLALEAEGSDGGPVALQVGVDANPLVDVRAARNRPELLKLPPRNAPGARLELVPNPESSAVRLGSLTFSESGPRSPAPPIAAFVLAVAVTAALLRRLPATVATGLGLGFAALIALARTPLLLYLTLPAPAAVFRVAVPWLLLAGSAALAWTAGAAARRTWIRGLTLLAAVVFGAWVRGYFLPSTGSWDTEYWKAWMMRAASDGVAHVYGDPMAVPPGRFLAQLRGEEELWKVDFHGRAFVVDYPPLAMAAWRWSWWSMTTWSRLDAGEAQNAAVKIPPVLGDLAAIFVLLWALRRTPARAATLAAVYWALPVSWVSSAVLGYLDGALAPLVVVSVVAAGLGQPVLAGAALAAGALVKPTAVIVAPAVVVALAASRASWRQALVSGLVVVAVALIPFVVAGTLPTAVVHVYRILFQGTLSGGYPNPWWLLGHALTASRDGTSWLGSVRYARLDTVPFPARTLGTTLFGLWAVYVVLRHRGKEGPHAAALAGAALVFGYGMLAVGVHENHPHPLVLLLLATGLPSRRLQAIGTVAGTVYVLNMLTLSGLGRFHGLRYAALEPLARSLANLRLAPGFDLTLLLTAFNVAAFAFLTAHLGDELSGLATPARRATSGDGSTGGR